MLITKIPAQLSLLLASARSSAISLITSITDALDLLVSATVGNDQPNMAVIPVRNRRGDVCAREIADHASINAHADVPMYAAPVTKEWQFLTFGKTTTGKTGHPQPSRFAP